MYVRLGDSGDAQPFRLSDLQIAVNVTLGIDEDRLAGALAADEVARLGEFVVVDHAEEHGDSYRAEFTTEGTENTTMIVGMSHRLANMPQAGRCKMAKKNGCGFPQGV